MKATTGLRSVVLLSISIAVTMFIMPGCSREKKSSSNSTTQALDSVNFPPDVHRDSSQQMRLDSLQARLDDTYRSRPHELIARLGAPVSAETLVTKNIHTDEQDFIYKYRLKGVAVSTYYATGSDRHLLVSVETDDLAELSSLGLAAGMRSDSLRRLLGREDSTIVDGNRVVRLYYEIGDDAVSDLFFLFRDDTLLLITYQPYMD